MELSSIAKKARAHHWKGKEDLKATKHSVEEAECALAAAKARVAEHSRAVKTSRVQVSATEDQALVASTCLLPLEEECQRMIAPSLPELRAKALARLQKDKVDKAKELEEQIKKLGHIK